MNAIEQQLNESALSLKDPIKDSIIDLLSQLEGEVLIEVINDLRKTIHEYSPFKNEPVDYVKWVPNDTLKPNDWNPNSVAGPEMRLLKLSIQKDGFTMPIVTMENEEGYEIVDGAHRTKSVKGDKDIKLRLHGYAPISIINDTTSSVSDRMSSTIRHNLARGVHGVIPTSDMVADVIRRGWSDEQVMKEFGMQQDEVLRFKHITGLGVIFKDEEYSKSWE
jgi:ParB-like chromosome segregation protein Spo0J